MQVNQVNKFWLFVNPTENILFILFIHLFIFLQLPIKKLHQKSKAIFLECAPRPCEEATDVLACLKLLDGTLSQECATKDTYLL